MSKIIPGIICLCFTLFFSQNLSAQTINHEIGVQLAGFDDFNFIYKKQLKENVFLRVRGTNLNINFKNKAANINQKDYRRMGFSSGAAVGWEHRIPITEKFKFYHGPEVGLTLGYSTFLDTNSYQGLAMSWGLVTTLAKGLPWLWRQFQELVQT